MNSDCCAIYDKIIYNNQRVMTAEIVLHTSLSAVDYIIIIYYSNVIILLVYAAVVIVRGCRMWMPLARAYLYIKCVLNE